jgi:hypothetical protein
MAVQPIGLVCFGLQVKSLQPSGSAAQLYKHKQIAARKRELEKLRLSANLSQDQMHLEKTLENKGKKGI